MAKKISKEKSASGSTFSVTIFDKHATSVLSGLSKDQLRFISDEIARSQELILLRYLNEYHFYLPVDKKDVSPQSLEKLRIKGNELQQNANKAAKDHLLIVNLTGNPEFALAVAEGAALGNYQFLKYLSARKDKKNKLEHIYVRDAQVTDTQLIELAELVQAVNFARDLVNEPVSYLNAERFAVEMQKACREVGCKVQVLDRKQIESLKMGGLLGVNRGSMDPPTFTVIEHKPAKAKNKKPIVLVGKGVVFDTGGLSLKPTPGSMDEMKCDMSGGAAVAGAMRAIAANKLPVHVVGLIPATDNRPGMNAIVPQDIITISDGTTVEVLNTDAEGRLILADALVYAKKYKPELVIDLATLTGAAVRAIGVNATAMMGTASKEKRHQLESTGMQVWERLIEFPLWQEFGDEMKSDIADLKNLGGAYAGHISAGKFLEHFTDYPWIHLDIAGPAYSNSGNAYRTKGGSGVGVRLLYRFIKEHFA